MSDMPQDKQLEIEKAKRTAQKMEQQRKRPVPPPPTKNKELPPLPPQKRRLPPAPPKKQVQVEPLTPKMELEKFLGDMRLLSSVVQKAGGDQLIEDLDTTLDDLINDQNRDPMVRQFAGQFSRYLPVLKDFEKSDEDERDIGNGERFVRNGLTILVMKGDKIVCKPGDDRRNIDIQARTYGEMLSKDKPTYVDGFTTMTSLMQGSEMLKDSTEKMLTLSQGLDRKDRDKIRVTLQAAGRKIGNDAPEKNAAKQAQKLLTPPRSIKRDF